MPLKLVPPRKNFSPYYRVRGTYLGLYLDRSTKACKRAIALKVLKTWEREIEAGQFAAKNEATFSEAALSYMKVGGERRFLKPLIQHFENESLSRINQNVIDAAADALYPNATAATRNRQVYTPVSAVLRHAGSILNLRRPQGSGGTKRTTWMWPEQVQRLLPEAYKLDAEFGCFLVVLIYTGMRLGEVIGVEGEYEPLQCAGIRLDEAFAYLPTSKNEEPRAVFLAPIVVEALKNHPRGMDREGPLFRFRKDKALYKLLRRACAAAEIALPPRHGFHVLCHTWATWMRRYAGLDTKGLVGTGRWKDAKSAERYEHVVVSEESRRASLLPGAIPAQNRPIAKKRK